MKYVYTHAPIARSICIDRRCLGFLSLCLSLCAYRLLFFSTYGKFRDFFSFSLEHPVYISHCASIRRRYVYLSISVCIYICIYLYSPVSVFVSISIYLYVIGGDSGVISTTHGSVRNEVHMSVYLSLSMSRCVYDTSMKEKERLRQCEARKREQEIRILSSPSSSLSIQKCGDL